MKVAFFRLLHHTSRAMLLTIRLNLQTRNWRVHSALLTASTLVILAMYFLIFSTYSYFLFFFFITVILKLSRTLPITALKPLVQTLISQLPEGGPAVIVVKPEVPTSGFANGQRPQAKGPVYDPTIVYLLELATVLALRDSSTVAELGRDVAEALQGVVRDAANVHSTVASRSAFYLLSLLKASHVRIFDWSY